MHKKQTLENYINALSFGGTKTLPDLYQIAGISFDFSATNIHALSEFVQDELNKLL